MLLPLQPQAEEKEQSAAAASAPSKAALKRARKKAAATAAQAQAAGHTAAPAATPPSSATETAAAAPVSGRVAGSGSRSPATGAPQQVPDSAEGCLAPADAASVQPAAAVTTAADAELQALRLSDDGTSCAAPAHAEPWMICPLTKVCSRASPVRSRAQLAFQAHCRQPRMLPMTEWHVS